jgi:inosose dehydratase
LSFAGEDAIAVLKKYIHRIKHVHLKGVRLTALAEAKQKGYSFLDAVRYGSFTVPGDGDFDFKPVFELLDEADYEGWIVVEAEQDPAIANPYEYACLARQYIRDIAGI